MTCSFTAIFSQFGLHATLGWFLPELRAPFVVKPIDSFRIDDPAFTKEEQIAIAIATVAEKFAASLSYRVAMRRQSFNRQNIRSIWLRFL